MQDAQDSVQQDRGNEYPPDVGVVPVQAIKPSSTHQRASQLRTGNESTGNQKEEESNHIYDGCSQYHVVNCWRTEPTHQDRSDFLSTEFERCIGLFGEMMHDATERCYSAIYLQASCGSYLFGDCLAEIVGASRHEAALRDQLIG